MEVVTSEGFCKYHHRISVGEGVWRNWTLIPRKNNLGPWGELFALTVLGIRREDKRKNDRNLKIGK